MIKSKNQKNTFTKRTSRSFFVSFLVFALFGLFNSQIYAKTESVKDEQQAQRTVKGVVVDTHGNPLIGVNILLKGKSKGTITDIDGKFSLAVDSESDELVFSYIGYKTVTMKANNSEVNVTMVEDTSILEEVVVVGYGTQKKENLTGAVASVDLQEAMGSRPVADIARGLQGTIPGMNIVIPSGEIGSDPVIKIRGAVASVEGTNKPLILLDNVEIKSLQLINMDDIESVSVLKDAASAAIYGSKAAFGVVLLTSKKGAKTDKFEISYSNNFSWQDPAKELKMGGIEGLQYSLDANKNMQSTISAGGFWRISDASMKKIREWDSKYGGSVKKGDPVVFKRDWDWNGSEKYGYRTYDVLDALVEEWAPTMSHNLSVSGRSNKTMYHIGLGLLDQSGMMKPAKHDDFKRYNASFSISSELNKYISVRAGAVYSDRKKRYPAMGGTTSDPWLYVYRYSPLFPVGVQDQHGDNIFEPIFELSSTNTDILQNKYYSINIGATVNILKNWSAHIDYTYSRDNEENNTSYPQLPESGHTWYGTNPWVDDSGLQVYVDDDGNITNNGGYAAYRFPVQRNLPSQVAKPFVKRKSTVENQNTLNIFSTYDLNLGDAQQHGLKFMAGINRVTNDRNWFSGERKDMIMDDNPQLNLAQGDQFVDSGDTWSSQIGFFGRVNYAYDSKYLFEANLRYDGSSVFSKHLYWEWFPSVSAGWVLSNEKFMETLNPVWSFAKLRASWGSIGDQSIKDRYLYRSMLESFTSTWISGGNKLLSMGTPSLYDADIKWQRIENLNLGFDFRFWKDKIGVTFDWYQRDTKDMIIPGETLPVTLGAASPKGNYGNLRTRGWEIALDFNHRFDFGLGINVNASLADATTMITKGADYNLAWEDRSLGTEFSTGRRYGDIYGYVTDRLFQKEDFVYENGNIVKETIIYNGSPKETNKQSGRNPVYQVEFESGTTMLFAPGDTKYVDVDGDGYISSGNSTNGNPGDQVVIGNSTPRYEYGFRLGADYKGFDFAIFMQGIGKRKIWGDGHIAIIGYDAKTGAIPYTFASDYWREDRTDAFYPRAWTMEQSNDKFSMKKQSKYLLDMSYFRIKNITLGYSLPSTLIQKAFISKARVYVSLENFFTFDNLRGLPIDPETISGYSMFRDDNRYNLGRTGMGTPIFKSVSFGLQVTF